MIKSTEALSLETICQIASDLKKSGKRIGFTHGAFDLFHYSHLNLLQRSAAKCDFLIVGIDSDRNIAKYKDYRRPIVGQEYRYRIINELTCVGCAFINDVGIDDVWINIERRLQPDIIFFGDRYGLSRVRIKGEADAVGAKLLKISGRIETTTQIIQKILKLYTGKYVHSGLEGALVS